MQANPNRRILVSALLFLALSISETGGQILFAPASAAQGDPLIVWAGSDLPIEEASARLEDQAGKILSKASSFFLPSAEGGYLYGFILAIPLRAKPGQALISAALSLAGEDGTVIKKDLKLPLTIEAKQFKREDISLDEANTQLREAPDPARDAQSEAFAQLFDTRDQTALFASGLMVKPLSVPWRETAGFADERRYLYSNGTTDSSVHGGLDLGAKEGSPVDACAAGRVIFAAKRILTGNTIVIEHLPGLFSIYMHLSVLEATEGEVVDSGQRIGLVGSTGLSTGPHLHWELRVGSTSVNPYYWLTRPLLDKSAVSGKIKLPIEGR
ncbi:MAG: M23 family metallopeptidase [Spirochaetes bacterium]|nr:M23 family metallopeptidase [Spirochaetota bacterium]